MTMSNHRHARSALPAHRMKALADAVGLEFAPHHEPSVWLREAISDLRAGIMAAPFRVCPHLRPGMVVVTALWAPDQMVCPQMHAHAVGHWRRGPQVRPLRRHRRGWADPSGHDVPRPHGRIAGAARALPNVLAARGRLMTVATDPRRRTLSPGPSRTAERSASDHPYGSGTFEVNQPGGRWLRVNGHLPLT